MSSHGPVPAPDEKVCPFCAETIKRAAVKCRYCQSELPADDGPEQVPPPPPPPVPIPAPVAEDGTPLEGEDAASTDAKIKRSSRRKGVAGSRAAGSGGRLASGRLTIALIIGCLLLAAGAVGTRLWAQHQDDKEVAGAISSAQARDAGIQQAATLTQKVLSYDWSNLDADIKSTEQVLAPSFRSEYAKTMESVRDQTLKNQVKLQARVVASSTVSATTDKVAALVFVDQETTAKGTNNRRLDQNRVLVTLTRHGGEWRVSKMDAF